MDKIKKHLAKLPRRKRDRVEQALCDIYLRRMAGYAMKKIRGHQFLYRIRIEDQRIIFYMDHEGHLFFRNRKSPIKVLKGI